MDDADENLGDKGYVADIKEAMGNPHHGISLWLVAGLVCFGGGRRSSTR